MVVTDHNSMETQQNRPEAVSWMRRDYMEVQYNDDQGIDSKFMAKGVFRF